MFQVCASDEWSLSYPEKSFRGVMSAQEPVYISTNAVIFPCGRNKTVNKRRPFTDYIDGVTYRSRMNG